MSSLPINRIAYIDPQEQLNTISPQGHSRRLLTSDQTIEPELGQPNSNSRSSFQLPTWSPNGEQIAVVGSDGQSAAIYAISDQLTSPQLKQLYFKDSQLPFYIYWSPDSQSISFIASNAANSIGFYVVSVDDGICNLLATGQPFFWAWMPENNQILVHSGVNYPEARLALINVKRGDVVNENIAQPGYFQAPGIAPSGRYWAYAEIDAYDNGQLVVADIATQEQIEVPHEGAVAFGWSPTADQLAFIAPPTPMQRYYGHLQLLDTAQKSVRTLVSETVLAFFWSPTGQHLAYFTLADTIKAQPANKINQSVNGSGNGSYKNNGFARKKVLDQPYRSPDTLLLDLWVVGIADRNKEKIATIKPSSLFINQFLPFFDQFSLSHRLWSPDGTALVLPVDTDNSTHILVIAIDGSSPMAIAEGKIAFWSWQ